MIAVFSNAFHQSRTIHTGIYLNLHLPQVERQIKRMKGLLHAPPVHVTVVRYPDKGIMWDRLLVSDF